MTVGIRLLISEKTSLRVGIRDAERNNNQVQYARVWVEGDDHVGLRAVLVSALWLDHAVVVLDVDIVVASSSSYTDVTSGAPSALTLLPRASGRHPDHHRRRIPTTPTTPMARNNTAPPANPTAYGTGPAAGALRG
jgi:hypothetical protein|eukprot:m.73193 g.73193  ORF g.73193 m.73193 type:complete len:136 (-) comp18784_c0_seq1:2151-2558(-)